ncbi:MAG: T9SS type A sorting domain-containing protein [Salinivirgaceae bacterium]|nr:T9SS type A sorting domain-containing protein [Salinivirgaceae bacterium]
MIGTISGGGGTTYSGNGVTLTVGAASGGNSSSYTYQWYESTNNGTSWSAVGTNSRSYAATGSGQTKKYYVKVTDADSQTASASAVSVTWRSPVAIGSISGGGGTTYSGNNVTLTVGAASGGNNSSYIYQWYESTNNGTSWTPVGTNSTSYSATGSGQTKKYYVKVTDADSRTATASAVSVTWRSPLTIGSIGGATTTYSNNSVSLTVGAASGGNSSSYTYQWYESTNNGTSWSAVGTNSTSYTATGSGQTKKYYVKVTDADSRTATASAVSVTWRSPLAAGTISGGGAYHYGANVTLEANPSGGLEGNSYSYQWQSTTSSSWSDIAGAKSKTYSVSGGNQTIRYRVVVSSDNQTQTSNPVDVTWRPELVAGAITGGNVTTYSGNSITLTAHPSGGTENNYSYQWKQSADDINWSVIAGQAGQTCTVTGTEQTMHFKVVVTNDNQTKESQSVSVTWGSALTAGSITSNPADHSTYSGGSITLTAHPSVGDQQNVNYVYQWQVEENSVWKDIQNANSQSYTESNTNSSSSALYKNFRIKVSAESQTAYSARYEVSWRPALVAGTITGGGGYSYGASATLQAHPSGGLGGNNYSYQWQESSNNSSWSDIAGAINKEYSVIGYNQTKYYRVKVSGDSQNKTSESVQVTWRQALAVGSVSGGGVTTYSGGSVTLQAEQPTGGNGTYAYQWQESTDNTNWVNITSAGNYQSYAVSSANPGSSNITKYYRAVVTSDNQSKETQSVTVAYRPALTVAISNNDVSTYSGNAIPLTAVPSGGDGEHYSLQWQVYSGSAWNDVQNETGGQFSIGVPNSGNTLLSRNYRVKVSGDSQTAYSAEVTLSWRPALVAGAISGATTTYSGNTVTLAINPSGGDGDYAYQWQVSEDNTTWTNIPGAIYSSLAETGVNETNAQATMYYRVVVTGDSQSAVSGVAEVIRRPSLKVGNILGNNIVYGGDAVNLSVVATGGNETYSYQWYRKSAESDWAAVGTNSPSFSDSFENNTNATISYLYKVVVSGDSQEKTTDVLVCSWVASMQVDEFIYAQDKLSYGVNTPITVRMINGSGIYDYQWQTRVNGVWQDIPDTDEPTYIVENLTEAREFRCVVSDSLYPTKILTTDVAQLDVYPDLIPGEAFGYSYAVIADPVTIGGTAASGGNGVYYYRWEKCSASDNGVFVPIAEATPTISVLPDCNTIYRRYDISGDQEKHAFDIQVNVPLLSGSITVDGLEKYYYVGQQLPLLQNGTAASGGNVGGTASYQWYSKGESDNAYAPIEGATSADYQPVGLTENTSFYRAIVDGNQELSSNIIAFNIRIPDITISNQKENYCQGDAVSIEASGVEGGEYKWFDATGNLIASGATLNLNSIGATTTLKLRTYINTDELLTEEDVALTVVDMTPDFASDRIIVDAGDVVHFTNNGSDYTQCEWDFGDGADGSFESEPWHYYNHGGTFDVKLRLTSSEGCQVEITKAGAIIVNEAVSTDVEADKAGSVSVYPNPVTDWLTVEADGEFVVTITNNLGSVVFKSTASTNLRIDITNYPEGIYTVGVVDGAGNAHFEQIVKY